MATHHHMKTLKGALRWYLAGIALTYVLVVSAVGAVA